MEEVKNGRKSIIGYGTFFHIYAVSDAVAERITMTLDRDEAQRYLEHPILDERIREITEALLEHNGKTASSIFSDIDAIKVHSCMTMFDFLFPNDIFGEVLRSFYNEERCEITFKVMQ